MKYEKPKSEGIQEKAKLREFNPKNFGTGGKCKYIRSTPPEYKYIKSDKQKVK